MKMFHMLLYTTLLLSLTTQCYGTQEYLLLSDLSGLGSSLKDFTQAIYNIFHTQPDGISLNHQNLGHSIDVAAKYKRWCYKTLETTTYTTEETQSSYRVVGSALAVNRENKLAFIKVKVSSKWVEGAKVSTSTSPGLSFKTEFEVKGHFNSGLDWSFNVAGSSSKKKEFVRLINHELEVDVPPRSKKEVKVVALVQKGLLHFTTPISVHGTVGVNYGSRVGGHYIWFHDIRRLVPRTRGEISGTVTGMKVVSTDFDIGAAEPLTGYELEGRL